jgi:hypothetical protein
MQIRQAAAAAKAALLKQAATRLGAKQGDLKAANGVISDPRGETVKRCSLLSR